jgi:phosphate/sulfate permease
MLNWYIIGVSVCIITFAIGIGETDGYDVLTDAKVIGVIIIGSLILAPIWPLIVAGFVVTAVLDEREKQRREDARRSRQDGTPPGP